MKLSRKELKDTSWRYLRGLILKEGNLSPSDESLLKSSGSGRRLRNNVLKVVSNKFSSVTYISTPKPDISFAVQYIPTNQVLFDTQTNRVVIENPSDEIIKSLNLKLESI